VLDLSIGPRPEATVAEVVFSRRQIEARLTELAAAIVKTYAGQALVILGVQPGSARFQADLLPQLSIDYLLDSIAVSRYQPAGSDTPPVHLLRDPTLDIEGKPVLLLMDVFDTGLTYHYLCQTLIPRFPASLDLCALLTRPGRRLVDLPARFTGFTAPDDHLVGYGLAYDDHFADLPDIHRLGLAKHS
jgi:hypoxanthine phosphoribosyltransferase